MSLSFLLGIGSRKLLARRFVTVLSTDRRLDRNFDIKYGPRKLPTHCIFRTSIAKEPRSPIAPIRYCAITLDSISWCHFERCTVQKDRHEKAKNFAAQQERESAAESRCSLCHGGCEHCPRSLKFHVRRPGYVPHWGRLSHNWVPLLPFPKNIGCGGVAAVACPHVCNELWHWQLHQLLGYQQTNKFSAC